MELEITPKAFYIGDINVGQSVVVAWGVMVVLIALAIAVKIKSKNFTEVPKGLQNLLELGVETIQKYSKTEVGSVWEEIAPYCATIGLYIFGCCMVELIGIRAPTTDLSMTLALGLGTFFWINYMGFRKKGFFGRMKHYVKPIPIIPILTERCGPDLHGVPTLRQHPRRHDRHGADLWRAAVLRDCDSGGAVPVL